MFWGIASLALGLWFILKNGLCLPPGHGLHNRSYVSTWRARAVESTLYPTIIAFVLHRKEFLYPVNFSFAACPAQKMANAENVDYVIMSNMEGVSGVIRHPRLVEEPTSAVNFNAWWSPITIGRCFVSRRQLHSGSLVCSAVRGHSFLQTRIQQATSLSRISIRLILMDELLQHCLRELAFDGDLGKSILFSTLGVYVRCMHCQHWFSRGGP